MMLAFLSILGGVYTFGAKGLIVGPVVLSLVLSAYPHLPLRRAAAAPCPPRVPRPGCRAGRRRSHVARWPWALVPP